MKFLAIVSLLLATFFLHNSLDAKTWEELLAENAPLLSDDVHRVIKEQCVAYTAGQLPMLAHPIFIQGKGVEQPVDSSKPRILLIGVEYSYSGAECHLVTLYKMLRQNGYYVVLLVAVNSESGIINYLNQFGLPYYRTYAMVFNFFRPMYHFMLQYCIYELCANNKISIIHSNSPMVMQDVLEIKKQLPVKTIFTYHVLDFFPTEHIRSIDAVVSVNPFEGMNYIETENRKHSLNIRNIVHIPPLYDSERFLAYVSTEARDVFFKKNFDLTLKSYPIVAVVANFYQDLSIKNHPMLFQAIRTLVYEKGKPIQVMLAGSGPGRATLENLVKEFSLEKYVNFLGFTDCVAGLLYHSDMLVMSSAHEAFGMVYCEAGLMHKPSVGAYQTGAEAIIMHEKTGLLFKHNDVTDLVKNIERLIDNKEFAQQLGNNAYDHIVKNFLPEVVFKKYEELYKII